MGFYESFTDATDGARSEDWTSMSIAGRARESDHSLQGLTQEFLEDEVGVDRTFQSLTSEAGSDPEGAFAKAGVMTLVLNNALAAAAVSVTPANAAASGSPKVITRLQKTLAQLHTLLAAIKAGSVAISFTITVGLPLGVSIGMTF